jgi:lysyl-tRNA synthetase class 1
MPLLIPPETCKILENVDAGLQPLAEFELADQLSVVLNDAGLSSNERRGASAEWAAFFFRALGDENAGPWNTYYGPTLTASNAQGHPVYIPDLAQVDTETVAHWEQRSTAAKHPILRARYADLVWDLKPHAIQQRADVQFARIAIDAYIDAIRARLYKHSVSSVQSLQRALALALITKDSARLQMCKGVMLVSFDAVTESREFGNWTMVVDKTLRNKKLDLTQEETARFVTGLERLLAACTIAGSPQFDPWAAEAAATVLASHYDRTSQKDQVHRVIRAYGTAFEYIAANASATFAMGWLQPIFDEYRSRGMTADADRVLQAYTDKGKHAADDLKSIHAPIEIPEAEFEKFLDAISEGTVPECLARVAVRFIPKAGKIRDLLQEMLSRTPILARIEVTRIVDGHFAAQAGSIETDPDGRLIMQLAQYIDGEDLFLIPALERIRQRHQPDARTILSVLEASPIFDPERRALLEGGIQAYLAGDHVKAIHVFIPQVEHTLRRLLTLLGVPTLRAGRSGLMQVKNLNEILREAAIQTALGEDLQLYLLTLLVDQRGQNIRNMICHGFASPVHFNQRVADRMLHVLLTLSLVRERTSPNAPTSTL